MERLLFTQNKDIDRKHMTTTKIKKKNIQKKERHTKKHREEELYQFISSTTHKVAWSCARDHEHDYATLHAISKAEGERERIEVNDSSAFTSSVSLCRDMGRRSSLVGVYDTRRKRDYSIVAT